MSIPHGVQAWDVHYCAPIFRLQLIQQYLKLAPDCK